MKPVHKTIIILLGLLLVACKTGSTCLPETVSYLIPPFPEENMEQIIQPQEINIKREEVLVDEVITGPVCNDTWSGTVYVTCDIQIPAWEEEALFFQDCDLKIEEGTVVYVEAHGNQPYYQGCSCHEQSDQ
jgi:hypothetical protein